MSENAAKKLPYELPFIAKYKFPKILLILYIFLILLSFFLFILLLHEVFIVSILALIFGLFFSYFIVATSLFKKYYVEITNNYIKVKAIFINKTIPWDEVVGISLDSDNAKNYIGIITKDKALRQQYLFTRIIDALHYGPYQVIINLNFLPHIDVERLTHTIRDKITNQNVESFLESERLLELEKAEIQKNEAPTSNIYKALIYCFLTSIIIGLFYGYLLNIFDRDMFIFLIVIPIAGYLLIIYIYEKNYAEQSFNIFHRLTIGLICIFPIIVGFISKEYFEANMIPNVPNFKIVVRNLSHSMNFRNEQFFIGLLLSVYIFIAGTLQGKRFKIQHKFYKLIHLYKKYGDYYCIKNGAFFLIYLVDPESVDHEYTEFLAVHIDFGCLVEKNKKRIVGFYIPKTLIEDVSIMLTDKQYVDLEGKQYFHVDLGGAEKSKPQPYHLPCVIFLNENNKMCVIQMQYFKDK